MKAPRIWPVFAAYGLVLVVVTVATAIALAVRAGMLGMPLSAAGELFDATAIIIGAGTTATTLALVALVFIRPRSLDDLRLRRVPGEGKIALVALLGSLGLGQTMDSALRLLGLHEGSVLAKFEGALAGIGAGQLVLAIVVLGSLTGFGEELFFRGYMQSRLGRRWRPWTAVIVTSVFFGLLHMDPVHIVVAGFLGVWLGFVTERVDSIRPSFWAHAGNNALSVVLAASGLSQLGPALVAPLGAVGLIVFVVCAGYMARVQKPAPSAPGSVDPAAGTALGAAARPGW